eukprot:7495-Eustigmatos_ZCMA.PRE.1
MAEPGAEDLQPDACAALAHEHGTSAASRARKVCPLASSPNVVLKRLIQAYHSVDLEFVCTGGRSCGLCHRCTSV